MDIVKYNEEIFTPTGLVLPQNLSFDECQSLGDKLRYVHNAILWCWGDWLIYIERNHGDKYTQALEESDYSYSTLSKAVYVCKKFEFFRRRKNLPITFHLEVAELTIEQQDELLDRCEEEHWTQKELRDAVKKLKRKLTETQNLPHETFDIIYCDPPWQYEFSETDNRKIENKYPTMPVEDICAMKLPKIAENALLIMWATAPKLIEAIEVIEKWGFVYKTHSIWDKEKIGMGYWFRGQHELLLIATKGDFSPPNPEYRNPSIYKEKRKEHSQKPIFFYEWIEKAFGERNRIELFARNERINWSSWGNERF